METRLPNDAWVKTTQGDKQIKDLVTGDEVVVYDVPGRILGFSPVTVSPASNEKRITFLIHHLRWVSLLAGTECYTNGGTVRADSFPDLLVCYCIVNPTKLVPRRIADIGEYGDVEAKTITWEGTAYMWTEGLLVGSRT